MGLSSGRSSATMSGPLGAIAPFDRLASGLDEFAAHRSMVVIDLFFVTAHDEGSMGQRADCARPTNHDRVGIGGEQLDHLGGHAGVSARIALVAHELNSGGGPPDIV